MTINMCEIKDETVCSGCRAALLLVRYPEIAGSEKISGLFRTKAENFAGFVRDKAFAKAQTEFSDYLESGGRRSAFPQREYRMSISVISEHCGYISVKDEIISVFGGIIKSYAMDITTWDVNSETVCLISDFTPDKPKVKYDGFYLKNGKPVPYIINTLWENGDCRMRDIKRFFTELKIDGKSSGNNKRGLFGLFKAASGTKNR